MLNFLKNKTTITQLSIILLGLLLFLPGLGNVHLFDWDEINFAESAREMINSGNYLTVQINFEPFWEKPPLFIWFQVLSMKIFGINEFAARFPNAICGIATLLTLFNIGKTLKNYRFGILWVLLYVGSIFPFFYFKSGIIDPWFNLFIFLGIYFFARFTSAERKGNGYNFLMFSGLFLGLSILTKGPAGLLIFLLSFGIYLIATKFKWNYTWKHVAVFSSILIFVGSFWFLLQILMGNSKIIEDFIVYQIRLFQTKDAGHGGFLLYHFAILFIGVFPASILALPTFRSSIIKQETDTNTQNVFRWMMITFWVVLILFTIVKTKIVHYSSMCYFPLTFFAAWYCDKLLTEKKKFPKTMQVLLIALAVLFGIATIIVTLFDKIKQYLIPYVKDAYTAGSMQATSTWTGFEPIIGLLLIATTITFCLQINKIKKLRTFAILTIGSLFFTWITMLLVVPQVEKYSQRATIEFYESKKGENCYIYPISRSYAHYFYSDRQAKNNCADKEFLMHGNIDKTCYFVLKNKTGRVDKFMSDVPDAIKLYEKNGYAFLVRHPKKQLIK